MICFDEGIFTNLGGESIAWVLILFDGTINVLVFITNSVILISVTRYWSRGKVSQNAKPNTILVIGLSASSITMSFTASYYFSYSFFCGVQRRASKEYWFCILRLCVVLTSYYSTAALNVAIAVDRYIAIVHVMAYERIVTPKRAMWTVVFIAVISTIEANLILFYNYWKPGILCYDLLILPQWYKIIFWHIDIAWQLIAIILCHWKIHVVTRNVKQRSADQPVTAFNNKPGQTMITVLPIYLVTWGPYVIASLSSYFGADIPSDVLNFCSTFSGLYYLLIPIRYYLYNVAVKNALREFFYFLMCKGKRLTGSRNKAKVSQISIINNENELPNEDPIS